MTSEANALIKRKLGREINEDDNEALNVLRLNYVNLEDMPKQEVEELITFIKAIGPDVSDEDL